MVYGTTVYYGNWVMILTGLFSGWTVVVLVLIPMILSRRINRPIRHPLVGIPMFEHPVKTMACKALANFLSFIPLYSGIHGDVILTNQPTWLDNAGANSSASDTSNFGRSWDTSIRPSWRWSGGLIKLFVAKHVEKDQRFIEFVRAHSTQCSDIIKVEAKAEQKREVQ